MEPHAKSVSANFESKISSFDCAASKTVDNIDVNNWKNVFISISRSSKYFFWKPKANMDINVCFGKRISNLTSYNLTLT